MFKQKDIKKLSTKKITKSLNQYDELINKYGKGMRFLGNIAVNEFKLTLWFIGALFMIGLSWFITDLYIGDFIFAGFWLVILLCYVYLFYDKFNFYNKLKGGLKWII